MKKEKFVRQAVKGFVKKEIRRIGKKRLRKEP